MSPTREPLELGTQTIFGEVVGITWMIGERYYYVADQTRISLMPAIVMEASKCLRQIK